MDKSYNVSATLSAVGSLQFDEDDIWKEEDWDDDEWEDDDDEW